MSKFVYNSTIKNKLVLVFCILQKSYKLHSTTKRTVTLENLKEYAENMKVQKKVGPYQDRTGDLFCVREA
jgi:hypothetical protein